MTKKKQPKNISRQKKKKETTAGFQASAPSVIILGIILFVTIFTFIPSLQNEFVNWDDDKNFTENPLVTQSTNIKSLIQNTPKIFSTTIIGNYNPLSNWTFALENVIFGIDQPFFWHLDNLLLHLICVFLIFRIALLLGLNLWGAAFTALLFGIHPMRVESVAWVTERKDVLFGTFFLLALFYYIKGLKVNQPNKHIVLIIILFLLSGLSKIQAVTLPLSMIAIDFLLGRKVSLKMVTDKWFYFIISLIIGVLGIIFLREQGSLDSTTDYTILERLAIGAYSYIVYLVKLLIPYRLSPLYAYPPQIPAIFYFYLIPALGVAALIIYTIIKEWRILGFGLLFFTFNIMFLLQIVGAGQGFIADRFTYIAYFGLFFLLGYGIQILVSHKKIKLPAIAVGATMLIIYSYLSFQQNKIWKNSGTLWTHVLQYYPNATLPWGNRANYYRDNGQLAAALNDYNEAIKLDNSKPQPFNSRGKLYFRSNNRDTLLLALSDYTNAITLDPQRGEYYMNRGSTYARLGDPNAAINDYNTAETLDPGNSNIYMNRSIVKHQLGDFRGEIADINTLLTLNSSNANMWANRGNAYMMLREWDKVLPDLNQAITLNPNVAVYYYFRAQYFYNTNNISAAQQNLQQAIQLGFQFSGGLENLAL